METLPLYAVGALDRSERQEVDAHLLSGCTACHTELKELLSAAAVLTYTLAPVPAPRTLKARIQAARTPRVTAPELQKRPNQPNLEPGEWMKHLFPPTPRFPTLAAPALLVLGLIFGATLLYMGYAAYVRTVEEAPVTASLREESEQARAKIVQLETHLRDREATLAQVKTAAESHDSSLTALRDRLALRETELEDLRTQLAQLDKDSLAMRRARVQADEVAGLFRSPTARAVALTGSDVGRQAGGLLLYDQPTGKAFLYAYNLPAPPAGSAYQVWAIDVKPILVGILKVDSGMKARLPIKGLATATQLSKFAVTVESAPGQPQPTGPIVLSASL